MYLLEIIRQVSMEQAGMYIALIKAKVKAPGDPFDNIAEISDLTGLAGGMVESATYSNQ